MKQVGHGIYYEDSFSGVTLGALVYPQGIIAIDAPLRAEDARTWRSMLINQRGWPNRLLVNLDAHPDRTLGARALESTILSHQKTAQVFQNRPTIFKGLSTESGATWESHTDTIGVRWAIPDITFSERMILHLGGPDVILEHHPGCTPETIWVIIPQDRVVFVGDTVVIDQPPFFATADLEPWLEQLDLLQTTFRDYVIISGRGGPVEKEDIRSQQRIIEHVLKGMERLARNNSPPEATEKLVQPILTKFFASELHQQHHVQRLRYGLHQGYLRRYRSVPPIEPAPPETIEQP